MRIITQFVFLLLISNSAFATLELKLIKDEKFIYVLLLNEGWDSERVKPNMCLSDFGALSFTFVNKNDEEYELTSLLHERCDRKYQVDVESSGLVGKFFDIEGLSSLYRLETGSYSVSAELCEPDRIKPVRCIKSNVISISN